MAALAVSPCAATGLPVRPWAQSARGPRASAPSRSRRRPRSRSGSRGCSIPARRPAGTGPDRGAWRSTGHPTPSSGAVPWPAPTGAPSSEQSAGGPFPIGNLGLFPQLLNPGMRAAGQLDVPLGLRQGLVPTTSIMSLIRPTASAASLTIQRVESGSLGETITESSSFASRWWSWKPWFSATTGITGRSWVDSGVNADGDLTHPRSKPCPPGFAKCPGSW